jgi:preprotein translocase subunit SecE
MAIVTKGNEGNEPMADDEKSEEQAELRKDEAPEPEDRDEEERAEARPKRTGPAAQPAARTGFFRIYKPGQGYWTRLCTALGAGLLIVVVAWFLYDKLRIIDGNDFPRWATGITAAFVIGTVILLWRYLNKPNVVDFFIATESEMKKVNWTSRKELFGSTKVVIVFMFLIASVLFLFDLMFGYFFKLIGLLKHGPLG